MRLVIRKATAQDIPNIRRLLRANRADPSLFQRSARQVRASLDAFHLCEHADVLVGCAALVHRGRDAEITGVSVAPNSQSRGVGSALVRHLVRQAEEGEVHRLWLGTAKPEYFARFGFERFSRWQLPLWLLCHKLVLVFTQPVGRWLPALFGRHVFMRLPGDSP